MAFTRQEGIKLFQTLLTKNNKLVTGITAEALSLALTLERDKLAQVADFKSLKATQRVRDVYQILVDNNPDIASLVTS